jgi:hypothetical protein
MPPKKRKKTPNPKGNYIIHSVHTELPEEEEDVMNYVSFDPGKKNFDIRFESRSDDSIKTLQQAKYVIPYLRTKTWTGTSSEAVITVINILDSYSKLLKNTHVALIEDQMCINNDMMYLMTIIITYFLCRYPKMLVVTVSSRLKGTNLGAPPKISRKELKAWGEYKAKALARSRGDVKFLNYLTAQSKGLPPSKVKIDDSTDNLIQIEAFCVEAGYRLTPHKRTK